jgi:uncharacterized protein YcsI (UPF0317 family)
MAEPVAQVDSYKVPSIRRTDLAAMSPGQFSGVPPGHTPVFWGCGVTPQAVALTACIPEMFTHAAGHMFVSDLSLEGWPKPN